MYKPLMIANIMQSIHILTDGCHNFRVFLIEGTEPNLKQIDRYVRQSLMLVTALTLSSGMTRPQRSLSMPVSTTCR